MSSTSRTGSLIWLWLSAVVVAVDLWSKFVTNSSLKYGVPVEVLPVFDLRLSYNTGAAFSFLADAGGLQRWLFVLIAVVVSAVLLVWMKRTPRWQWWVGIAQALVLGGGIRQPLRPGRARLRDRLYLPALRRILLCGLQSC